MLDQYFSLPAVLRRHRSRLLGAFLDSFVAESRQLGYPRDTVRHQCEVIGCFSGWLERRHMDVDEVAASTVKRHVRWRRLAGRSDERVTLLRFLDHLQACGVVRRRPGQLRPSAAEKLIEWFEEHLTGERRILAGSASDYASFAREFLSVRYQSGVLRLRNLRASDVSNFVVTWTRRHPPGRARLLVVALRSFFRFLLQHGKIDVDLAAAVPTVAGWRLARLPRFLSAEQVERLLASCDRGSPQGSRDYAILLLLARLGVRAIEVARLELNDIDWRAGELIVRGKGCREDRLPLVPEVGEALAAYLRHGRPKCATRRVFVRVRAPVRAIGERGGVTTMVRAALDRAGIESPIKGAHMLRHSLATRMLQGGASMSEIAEVLRHRSPQTTEIYAKVDFGALRSLALPWPTMEGGR